MQTQVIARTPIFGAINCLKSYNINDAIESAKLRVCEYVSKNFEDADPAQFHVRTDIIPAHLDREVRDLSIAQMNELADLLYHSTIGRL